MGQGAESCGGYEVDDDQYCDGLESGMWTQRDGVQIRVDQMSQRHLQNAQKLAKNMARTATFSSDAEMWGEWVELFDRYLLAAPQNVAKYTSPAAVAVTRGAKTLMVCHCGAKYQARTADISRGWALSCSKRCASIRREYGRPAAKKVDP